MLSCDYNRSVSNRRILVTGGAGYIGSHTARMLLRRGYAVTVVDDLSRGYRHNVEARDFHQLRVQQTAEMAEVLAGHDAVIHFAAYISVGESMGVPEVYFENNVGGSTSLAAAMVRAGVKHLVFSSTAAVYGIPSASPIPESAAIAPVNPYGESKVMVETLLRWFDTIHGLRSVCLRYFNACGADPEGGLGEEHDPETKAENRALCLATITTRRTALAFAITFM
jgi:UDP-glucose 4-epimerase